MNLGRNDYFASCRGLSSVVKSKEIVELSTIYEEIECTIEAHSGQG